MMEKVLDNALMVMSMVLLLVALAVPVFGIIQMVSHGFSWVTLTWTIGFYVASGLLFSVISRGYTPAFSLAGGAKPSAS